MPTPPEKKSSYAVYTAVDTGGIIISRFDWRGMPESLGNVPSFVKMPRRTILGLHPSGKYLYAAQGFDIEKDGFDYDAFMDHKPIPKRAATDIFVFAIQPDGRLVQRQMLSIPGILAALMPHPGGRLLFGIGSGGGSAGTAGPGGDGMMAGKPRQVNDWEKLPDPGGVHIFSVGNDGRLNPVGRTACLYTFGLMDMSGERDAWGLDLSSDGHYCYSFCGDGFVDHSENYLRKFKIRGDGQFQPAGPTIYQQNGSPSTIRDVEPGVASFVPRGKWALVKGFGGLRLYASDRHAGLHPTPFNRIPVHPSVGQRVEGDDDRHVAAVDSTGRFFVTVREDRSVNVLYKLDDRRGAIPLSVFGEGGDLALTKSGNLIFEINVVSGGWTRQTPSLRYDTYLTSWSVSPDGKVTKNCSALKLGAEPVSESPVVAALG